MRKIIAKLALLLALCLCAPGMPCMAEATVDAVQIVLSDAGVTVNGAAAGSDADAAVYVANDIVFYLAGQDFTYGEGSEDDAHEQSEADAHTVVHITQPGTYAVSGSLSAGQIAVDLGEDADEEPTAVVTLVLNGVDITCSVAPAIIFYNVYECGDADEDSATSDVSTAAAGANIVVADGTVSNISGAYVARIYKPGSVELNEDYTEVVEAKKLHKYDGAVYSKMSMNIFGGDAGDGVLNINAENEGLCSDLHLTIEGGIINIVSGNDGINTSEDNVSVYTVNGGELNIQVSGETGEGDGIDSNGWLIINAGTVTSAAYGQSADAGIDSDKGIYLNGGSISASGNMLDAIAGGDATYAVFAFATAQTGGSEYLLKDSDGATVASWTPANDFSYLVVSDAAIQPGTYTLWRGDVQLQGAKSAAMGGMNGDAGSMPEGMTPSDDVQMPDGGSVPEMPGDVQDPGNFEVPEMPDGAQAPEMPDGDAAVPENPGEAAGGKMQVPQQGGFGGNPGGNFGGAPDSNFGGNPGNGNMPGSGGNFGGGMNGGRGGFGGMAQGGEASAEFVIEAGGNTFASVTEINTK